MAGAIKYNIDFKKGSPLPDYLIREINPIRDLMYRHKFIGVHPNGVGYGSAAQKLGKKEFIVTGTGTGGLKKLTGRHYSIVAGYDPQQNLVIPKAGAVKPSSEFMTLAAVFDCNHKINFALHGHIQKIWKNAKKLGIPITSKNAEYGTPKW